MASPTVVDRVHAPVETGPTSGKARKKYARDYRAEHERRTARARAAGYRSYRDMRNALWEPDGRRRERSRKPAEPGPAQKALW